MNNVVIVPVYKDQPNESEKLSLQQCLRVLHQYPIVLVCPQELDLSAYRQLYEENNVELKCEFFDGSYFESVSGYNRLLLSKQFYERFEKSDYMLIYQLDAFVFRDELDLWSSKKYDYIGAPWMKSDGNPDPENSGNGGFSLRNIKSHLELFDYKGKLLTFKGICCVHRYRGPVRKLIYILLGLLKKYNSVSYFTEKNIANEDVFFASLKYRKQAAFRIPPPEVAMKFAFEANSSLLFELNGRELPFGCHGWENGDNLTFWRSFIQRNAEK